MSDIKSANLNYVIDYNELLPAVGAKYTLSSSYDSVCIKNFPKGFNAIFDIRGSIKKLIIEESYISNLRVFRILSEIMMVDSHINFANFISNNKPKVGFENSIIEISQNNNLDKLLQLCNTKNIVSELDRVTFKGYTYVFPLNKKICLYEHTHLEDISSDDYNSIREVLTPYITDII